MPFNQPFSGQFGDSDQKIIDWMKQHILGMNLNPEKLQEPSPMEKLGLSRGGIIPGGNAEWAMNNPIPAVPQSQYFGSQAFANDPAANTTIAPKTTSGVPGMLSLGNIDLNNRPVVKNGKGISTVLSTSFNIDGKEVLIPRVSMDGKLLDEKGALEQYRKTGQHLGIFDSPASANAYAQQLHLDQEKQYAPPSLPNKNPKRGKTATLDLSDPVIVDAASDPKALAAAIKSAGDKPVLVRNAMAIGMGSDNVVVAGNKAKSDPAKVARSVQTPVVSKQGFIDVLGYIRGR